MRTLFLFMTLMASCSANLLANYYAPQSDTLITDSLALISDSLMISKMEVMETELEVISEQLNQISNDQNSQANDTKKKFVHFGLSLGYRWLTNSSSDENAFASVSPIDSTLRLTQLDRTSYLFSTSVVFDLNLGKLRSPSCDEDFRQKKMEKQDMVNERRAEKKKEPRTIRIQRTAFGRFMSKSIDRLCVVSNLNILDFSNGQKELAFNKSIEGGLGIGYRLNEVMYIGFNWEHVQSWQLYDDIKKFQGKKVELNGTDLVSSSQLDPDNEDLFYKKNLSGWGIKMIICL
jgi:hypothetical protein